MIVQKILEKVRNAVQSVRWSGISIKFSKEVREIDKLTDKIAIYERRHQLLRSIARRWGFELYNKNLNWQTETEFWEIWKAFPEWKGQLPDRKFVVWSMAESVKNLEGHSAECGVLSGASSHIICSVFQRNPNQVHHVFDSFEGLSEPSHIDSAEKLTSLVWKKGDLSVPLEAVKSNLSKFPFVEFYKGWIPTRFHEVENVKFKFVHVDVDLYQPTKDSLEFFYQRLIPGGILLCDDYGSTSCIGATKAFDEVIRGKAENRVIHLPTGQGFIIKR